MDDADYVTLTDAADTADVPVSTLRHWIENGELPAAASDRGRLVRLDDVWRLAELTADERAPIVEEADDASVAPGVLPAVVPPAARRRRGIIVAGSSALLAKLDELYRAQLAAKEGEIAAKDELIAELRLRAERAEGQLADVEQRLATVQAVREAPVTPAPSGFVARLFSWRHRSRDIAILEKYDG